MKKMIAGWILLLGILWMSVAAFSEAVPVDLALRMGDTGDAVTELQTRLKSLNYYTGKVTGEYGTLTQTAVMEVQKAYGLEVTGEADDETLEIIYGDCYRPLSVNDQGKDVENLQQRLTELGYYSASISGKYLTKTKAAVAQVQEDFGMEATGVADVWTLELIYSRIVKPTPSPIPAGAADNPTEFRKELSYGSTGKDVQLVQERLKELGYFTYHKTTTGYYKQTQQAVKDFQGMNGLIVTGKVDEKTWNALFYDETVVAADGVAKPAATPEPIPYAIEVDVNNQLVKIWAYNSETEDYTDMYKCFLCSTGTKSHPSAPGTYILSGRKARWCYFPNWGGGKAQYWVKIDEEIAFHSVIYSAYDPMTLKVSSLNALGKRASHGCIRLTVADSKWIYDHCGAGTVVTIREDRPADPELVARSKPGKLDKSVMLPVTTPEPVVYPPYDAGDPPTQVTKLTTDDVGQAVYWLQMRLKELGYFTGEATGVYGSGTKSAVKAYQSANRLSGGGVANRETLSRLYTDAINEKATPEPTAAPTETPTPLPVRGTGTPDPKTVVPTPAPTPEVSRRPMDTSFIFATPTPGY